MLLGYNNIRLQRHTKYSVHFTTLYPISTGCWNENAGLHVNFSFALEAPKAHQMCCRYKTYALYLGMR